MDSVYSAYRFGTTALKMYGYWRVACEGYDKLEKAAFYFNAVSGTYRYFFPRSSELEEIKFERVPLLDSDSEKSENAESSGLSDSDSESESEFFRVIRKK